MNSAIPELRWNASACRLIFGTIGREPLWKGWIKSVALVLALASPIFCVTHGTDIHRLWREHRLSVVFERAQTFMVSGEREKALAILVTVGGEARKMKNLPVLRALAELASEDYPRESLELYLQVASASLLSLADRAEIAILHIRLGRRSEGLSMLTTLCAENAQDSRLQHLLARVQDPVSLVEGSLHYITQQDTTARSVCAELSAILERSNHVDIAGERFKAWLVQNPVTDADTIHRVSSWLMARGFPEIAADVIPSSLALKSGKLTALKIDALMNAEKWDAITAILMSPDVPLSHSTKAVLIALVSARSAKIDRTAVRENLDYALGICRREKSLGGIAGVAGIALDHHFDDLALKATRIHFELGFITLDSIDRYLNATRRNGESAESALDWLVGCTDHQAMGSEAMMAICYLKLLCGMDLEGASFEISKLRRNLPKAPRLDLLEALVSYRMGDVAGAKEKVAAIAPFSWQPGERAVLDGLLDKGGKANPPDSVSMRSLFPEEIRLISRKSGVQNLEKSLAHNAR